MLAVLTVIVIVVGGYVGWQLYNGQQMADQYMANVQKPVQGSGNSSVSLNSQAPGSKGLTPETLNQASSSQNTSSPDSSSPESQPNSSALSSPSATPYSKEYRHLMSSPYQQTLQAMQNAKRNTLALQGKSMSLSAYKASILQSQATFASAEAFVLANPPTEEKLNAPYQEFLAGIRLAKQSMSLVLNGISELSPSNFYAAREMGRQAQRQVVNAYAHY